MPMSGEAQGEQEGGIPGARRPPMKESICRIINLVEKHGNVGGSLIMFQPGERSDALPFVIKKVLFMTDMQPDDVRGGHAHHETEEVLVCLRGACTVDVDDGLGRRGSVRLDRRDRGILLYPHVWRVVRAFSYEAELLAVASREYDECDYIRSRPRFEKLAQTWAGNLGGSANQSIT